MNVAQPARPATDTPRSAQRPLVVRCGALGDMVLLTPLLALLHRRYGLAPDVLASGAWTPSLYAGHADVHDVLLLDSRRRPYWSDPRQWRLMRMLRAGGPRPVYVCDERATAPLAHLLRRAGFGDGDLLWVGQHPECAHTHWVDRWLAFGALDAPRWPGAPAARVDAVPRLEAGAGPREDCARWLAQRGWAGRPLLLLHPGNKRTLKRGGRRGRLGDSKAWPDAHWLALLQAMLARTPQALILLTGTPPEQPWLLRLARASGSPRVHAVGNDLPLPRLLALQARATGMACVDTGPAHCAAALGCPLLVLYGAASAAAWLPRSPTGSPVLWRGGADAGRGRLLDTAPGEAIAAWNTLPLRWPG